MIPPFDDNTGYLPPGNHDAAWQEFADRFGGGPYRHRLLSGLLDALKALRAAGCETAIIDGSFVTDKRFPGDFDAAWDPTNVDPNRLDPVLLDFKNRRAAMKTKYSGELFPATFYAAPGVRFREFFQRDKNGIPKGVVRLNLRDLP